MTTVLRADGLVKEYRPRGGFFARRAPVRVVDGVDLELRAGEAVAIVGESGAGKTTVSRMLALLEKPTHGRISLGDKDVTTIGARGLREFRRQVQIVFQNPYESLDPRHTVRVAAGEPLDINRIGSRAERAERTREVLRIVGLTPVERYLDRYPHELSGGQRQRVAIARALAVGPSVLIADEPVSMLDASIRSSILNLLSDLQSTLHLAIVFVTHDLATARFMSERLMVMYRGEVVETGPTEDVLAAPDHPYTRLLLSAAGNRLADHGKETL
ncbi:ATP-binding cassette domain-containing protein [Amycolatopsis jejuensis]|uniref:ATP-binding cassette domain-containing protein n=1 Tax=Amycolatopsis jejuensis TaxID=330084 RepID=UPI00068D93FB|nr:ATP-binding cassette domain-containing protein [Amycolatopsis jejuensis]